MLQWRRLQWCHKGITSFSYAKQVRGGENKGGEGGKGEEEGREGGEGEEVREGREGVGKERSGRLEGEGKGKEGRKGGGEG